jgi:hypothetical protein
MAASSDPAPPPTSTTVFTPDQCRLRRSAGVRRYAGLRARD